MAEIGIPGSSKKVTVSAEINLGHILTILSMLIGGFVAFGAREADLATIRSEMAHLEKQQDTIDKVNAEQDARWQVVLSDLKSDIRELRQQLDKLIDSRRIP